MKLSKKGFTLVELLAVVTILSIIGAIAVVSIDSVLDESKRTECDSIVKNLNIAVKDYVSDKRYTASLGSTIKVSDLINEGYFSNKIINPFTKEDVTDKIKEKTINISLNSDDTLSTADISFINCSGEDAFLK